MTCVYEFTLTGVCPVDGTMDEYAVKVTSTRMTAVETILEESGRIAGLAPIYQEHLTLALSDWFGVEATVETVGTHSGVKVTCTA